MKYIEGSDTDDGVTIFNSIKVDGEEETNNMKLGVLFDDSFSISIKSSNKDRVYKDLK